MWLPLALIYLWLPTLFLRPDPCLKELQILLCVSAHSYSVQEIPETFGQSLSMIFLQVHNLKAVPEIPKSEWDLVFFIAGFLKYIVAVHWLQLEEISQGKYAYASHHFVMVQGDFSELQIQIVEEISWHHRYLINNDNLQVFKGCSFFACPPLRERYELVPEFKPKARMECLAVIGVGNTQSDSIQCLDFAKKWIIQYPIQYCFTQDSIKKKSADSI